MAFILISAAMAVITVVCLHRIDEGGSPVADLRRAADWGIAASGQVLPTLRRAWATGWELGSGLTTRAPMLIPELKDRVLNAARVVTAARSPRT